MIGFIVVGLIIGALARLLKPGKQGLGLLTTLLLGVVASVIGGTIAAVFGSGSIWELNIFGTIIAVIAAVVLLGIVETRAAGRQT